MLRKTVLPLLQNSRVFLGCLKLPIHFPIVIFHSHERFRKIGQTYSEYLNNMCLKNACHMLIHGSGPITEITRGFGFNNSKHFHHAFKSKYGITPLDYRNNYNKDFKKCIKRPLFARGLEVFLYMTHNCHRTSLIVFFEQ